MKHGTLSNLFVQSNSFTLNERYTGLLGWTGASKKNNILLKLFLILSFIVILAEIGAILTISIFKANSSQLIDQTWQEMNKKSHNLIQEGLLCCGLNGPNDYDNSRDIDQSCFYKEPDLPKNVGENGLVISEDPPVSSTSSLQTRERKINQVGCRTKISDWFFDNRLILLAVIGSVLIYQIITMLLTSAAISLGRRRRHDSLEELDAVSNDHLHHHHGASYM